MDTLFVAFFVFFAAAVVIGIAAALKMARLAEQAWSSTAGTLGFQRSPAGVFRRPKMHGTAHGCRVLVDTYTQSSGKSSTTYTRFRVGYPRELGVALKLTKQGFFSGLARAFGAQDIEVGDEAFDDAVVVKGADATAVREFLTPPRRQTIRRLFGAYPGLKISADGLEWSKRGVIRDASLLRSTVEELTSAARVLTPADEESDVAVAPTPPAPEPPIPVVAPPPPPPRRQETPAAPIPAPSEPEVVRRPEPELVPEPVPAPEPPGKPTVPEPAVASTHAALLDAEAICHVLFAEGVSTFEAGKRFDAEYRDQHVVGTGTLLSTGSFTYDFVLGRDGAKAVVEVFRVASPWKKEGEPVVAEIGLPAGAEEAWTSRVGTAVGFRGRLVKVDALMKKIHVLEGELAEA